MQAAAQASSLSDELRPSVRGGWGDLPTAPGRLKAHSIWRAQFPPGHLLPPPQSFLLAGLLCTCEPALACECVCSVYPCPWAGSLVSPGMGTLKALLLQEEACSTGKVTL